MAYDISEDNSHTITLASQLRCRVEKKKKASKHPNAFTVFCFVLFSSPGWCKCFLMQIFTKALDRIL